MLLGLPLRRRWCFHALTALLWVSGQSMAIAETPRLGYQLARGAATSAGSWQFLVERPWYAPERRYAIGLSFGYDRNLLRLPGSDGSLVAHSVIGSVDVAVSPLAWLLVRASVPVTLFESGTADPTSGDVPIERPALGDPSVGLLARLYGRAEQDRFSLHVGFDVWPGIGAVLGQRRDGMPRHEGEAEGKLLLPRVVLAGVFGGSGRWAVDSGFLYRPVAVIGSSGHEVVAASEVQVGAALGFAQDRDRLYLGLEARLRGRVTGFDVSASDAVKLDVLVAAQTLLWKRLQLGLAVGTTLFGAGSAAAPHFTTLLRLAWAPRAADQDHDRDGIPDSQDRCPYESEDRNGYRDDDGCPDALLAPPLVDALPGKPVEQSVPSRSSASLPRSVESELPIPNALHDTDGDGIPDREDRCPLVAEDRDGFEDEDGCPEPDNDEDGIADEQDLCPLEAETVNGRLDDDGCPEQAQAKIEISRNQLILKEQFRFRAGSAQLDPRSNPLLRELAQLLREHPRLVIEIQGHTDNVGDAKKNLQLSMQRAEAVCAFLIRTGIAQERLKAAGYGSERSLVPNNSVRNRAVNRRVELWIQAGVEK